MGRRTARPSPSRGPPTGETGSPALNRPPHTPSGSHVAWFPPVRTVGGGVCHPCSDSLHISRLTPHFPTVLRPGLKSAPSLVQELAPPQEVGHHRPPGPDRVVRVGHGGPLGVLVACPAVINLLLL